MNFKIAFLAVFLTLSFLGKGVAQELNAKVTINTPVNTTVDKTFYNEMEKSISDLMNNSTWTEDDYEVIEKIEVNITLTITAEIDANNFEGELIIQASRPIYNSLYQSPLINHVDKNVTFSYITQQVLRKSNDGYYDNLSSILSYYAYLILGLDADSFELYGGDKYFQEALNVINNLSGGLKDDAGWKNSGITKNNRYWILENLMNSRFRQFRQAYYEYHRLGLDDMIEDPDKRRAILSSALTAIGDVNESNQNSILLQIFSNTKREEVVEIFKVDERGPRSKIRNIMVRIDPANANKFDELK